MKVKFKQPTLFSLHKSKKKKNRSVCVMQIGTCLIKMWNIILIGMRNLKTECYNEKLLVVLVGN